MPPKKVSIRIDGALISATEGQTILQAAKSNSKHIPTLCDLEGLTPVGACRIRQRTLLLVSLGDCAVTGNVPAMRNSIPVNRLLQAIYMEGADEGKVIPADRVPPLLKQARPLREFVKVDLFLPGCPPPAKTITAVLQDLLEGKKSESLSVKFG